MTYFKAVRMDGTDFHTGIVRWLPPLAGSLPVGGLIVRHPTARKRTTGKAAHYLSVATVPTDCTGTGWPCRLARVERTRAAVWQPEPDALPNKAASWQWRVFEELDATLTLGPQGREVAALIERAARLTGDEVAGLAPGGTAGGAARRAAARAAAWYARRAAARATTWYAARDAARAAARAAARDAARDAARAAARDAARDAAGNAAWYAAGDAAGDAAGALTVRDLISTECYDTLTRPWASVIGLTEKD